MVSNVNILGREMIAVLPDNSRQMFGIVSYPVPSRGPRVCTRCSILILVALGFIW